MNSYNFSLTVLVPFYNEENYLEQSVKKLIEENVADQIILINDCSNDKSLEIAKNFINANQNILLLNKTINEGKGSAISFAKKYITSSHVIVHDADLEYSPSDIHKLKELAIDNPDYLILGSRTLKGPSRVKIYKSLVLINKLLSVVFSMLNSFKISDIATCYMLMPSRFFLNSKFKEKKFGIEVEILSKFLKSSDKIMESPISYVGRKYSEGKKITLFDGVSIFYKIIIYSKFYKKLT